jgi:hypothetical protein
VILWRVLPWRVRARVSDAGGALWFPRELQGAGRHDNPDLYGCIYVGEGPVSPIAEALAPFRGARWLTEGMLVRSGVQLALAELFLPDGSYVLDLDDPQVLLEVELRPSRVATNERSHTQSDAAKLFVEDPGPIALRWWSTIEASLANLTLFDRAETDLELINVTRLTISSTAVREAADLVGLG